MTVTVLSPLFPPHTCLPSGEITKFLQHLFPLEHSRQSSSADVDDGSLPDKRFVSTPNGHPDSDRHWYLLVGVDRLNDFVLDRIESENPVLFARYKRPRIRRENKSVGILKIRQLIFFVSAAFQVDPEVVGADIQAYALVCAS
jgi:hypothetical protein